MALPLNVFLNVLLHFENVPCHPISGDVLEEDVIKKNRSEQEVERRPTGHIVGIIRRKWRQYCGILQLSPVSGVILYIN